MRKVFLLMVAALITLIELLPTQTQASHNTGGDISYLYLSPNTYRVRYRFYRDQAGIPAPGSINLCYSSVSTGLSGNALLLPTAGTGGLIPPSPCIPPGSGYNIEEWIFEGVVALPQAAIDWKFDYSECCRNGAVCNVQPNGLYIYVTLDNLNFPTNSSPYFTSIPVTEFCVNNPFYWTHNAIDPDGDSLIYSLTSALDAGGFCPYTPMPATYIAPATPTDPLPTLNGTNINPNTGIVYFTPTVQCTYVVAVLCEEFDPVTLLKKGEVIRDMQINVSTGCNIIPPAFDSTFQVSGISILVDGSVNTACDDSVFFLVLNPPVQCGSIVTTDIRFTDANGVPNPVVAAQPWNCQNGLTDSIRVTLLNPIQIGTSYVYTKIGFDGNTFLSECGSSMPEFDSIAITLIDSSIYLFNADDTVGCSFNFLSVSTNQAVDCFTITATGSEFTLVDANGVNIPITSINCVGHYSNSLDLTLNPPPGIVGPLYLITQNGTDGNTFTNACGTAMAAGDTIATIVVLNYLPVNIGPDQTVCNSLPAPSLDAGAFSPSAVYSWTGPGGFTANTQVITATQTGQYIVTVTDGASCQGSDTVDIVIVSAPVVNLGLDVQLCVGEGFPLLDAGNTGATYQWYFNGTILTGEIFQLLFPDTAGQYVVAVDLGGGCVGYDTLNILVNPNLLINLGTDATICSNDPLPVLNAGAIAGASYVWTGPNVTAADTLNTLAITQGGTYSVLVTSASGCTGTDTYTLTVIQAPSVSLGLDQTYCAGDPVTPLDAGNPGASYVWTGPGTTAADTLQLYTPTQTGTFTVTVNNGGICNATGSVNITIVTALSVSINDVGYCQGGTFPVLQSTSSNTGVTYGWTLNGTTISGQTGQSLTTTGPGTYGVTISIGTCVANDLAVVTEIENPTPSLNNIGACDNDPVQTLNSNYPANGTFGTTYNWTGNGTANGQTFNPTLTTGTNNYSVTVTNTFGGVTCQATATMVYTVNPTPTVATINPVSKCGSPSSVTTLDAGNTSGATYQWFLNGTAIANATNQTYDIGSDASASGTYTVEVSNNGCKGTGGTTVTINANPQPAITDVDGVSTEVFFCNTPPYPVLSSGIEGAASYVWTLNGTTTGGNTSSITVQLEGTYAVIVTDANGCSGTNDIKVTEEVCDVEIPNVFTPNGDGTNQLFEIKNLLDFKTRKLTVYNRWGKEIYSNDAYNNNWDGEDAVSGTYYYVLEYANETVSETKHGIITIIKDKD